METKSVYIASPFFNEEQIERVKKIENILKENNLEYFSPRCESIQGAHETSIGRKAIFSNDEKAMRQCDFAIVVTNDKDMGTIFEAGYLFAKDKKVIYLFENDENLSVNLMLSQSAHSICTTMEQLKELIETKQYCKISVNSGDDVKNER